MGDNRIIGLWSVSSVVSERETSNGRCIIRMGDKKT